MRDNKSFFEYECNIQKGLTEWLHLQYPYLLWFSIPNGGYRNKFEARNLKSQGVLPGVADLFICKPSNSSCGLFLELKSNQGKLSKSQEEFSTRCELNGYDYKVAYSIEQAMNIINHYLRS